MIKKVDLRQLGNDPYISVEIPPITDLKDYYRICDVNGKYLGITDLSMVLALPTFAVKSTKKGYTTAISGVLTQIWSNKRLLLKNWSKVDIRRIDLEKGDPLVTSTNDLRLCFHFDGIPDHAQFKQKYLGKTRYQVTET